MLDRRAFCIAAAGLGPLVRAAYAKQLTLTPQAAHEAAASGDVLLIDIRTRYEWNITGIAKTALPVSMHEPSFVERLAKLVSGDKSRPIALICAHGERSRNMQKILTDLGYAKVYDVSQGMLGNVEGKGWIKAGLPTKPPQP